MTFTPPPPPEPTPPPQAVVTDCDGDGLTFTDEANDTLSARVEGCCSFIEVTKDDARALGQWLIEWADS